MSTLYPPTITSANIAGPNSIYVNWTPPELNFELVEGYRIYASNYSFNPNNHNFDPNDGLGEYKDIVDPFSTSSVFSFSGSVTTTLDIYISVASSNTNDGEAYSTVYQIQLNPPTKQTAVITVTPSFELVYAVDASFNLNATSDNLETEILYSSSDPNVATVDLSGNVYIVRAGETTITVSQEESATYLANSATSIIYVTTQSTVINVDASFNKVYGNETFYLNATSNSPATILYSIASADEIYATVNSVGQVTILGACPTFVLITIQQDGYESVITSTNEYSAATTTTELYITKQETLLALDPSYNKTYGVDVSFNVGATTNNTESLIVYSSSVPSVATIDTSGNVLVLQSGETVITASQSESDNFTADETTSTLYVSKGYSNLQMENSTFSKTYGLDVSFNVGATTNNTEEEIQYSIADETIATIDQSGNVNIFKAGSTTITVQQAASNNYFDAISSSSLIVSRQTTNIGLDASYNKIFGDASFNVNATTNNTETPIVYSSSNTLVATINSSTGEVILGSYAGETVITASQSETINYTESSKSSTLYVVNQQTVINVDASFNKVYGNEPFYLNPLSNSPAILTYSIPSADEIYATVNSNGQVTILGACPTFVTITIHQDAYENVVTSEYEYSSATTTTELYITKQNTDLGLDVSYNKTYGVDISFNVGATTNNTESLIVYSSSVPSVATIDNSGNVLVLQSGETVITASQSESDNFNEAETSSILYVSKGNANLQMQNTTFSKTFGTDVSFNVGATTNNTEVDIFYSTLDTTIATIDQSGNVYILKAGSTTITVQQAETVNYVQAESSSSLIVSRQTTAIELDSSYNKIFGDASFNVNATTNNTETPIVYSSSNLLVATIDASGQVMLGSYAGQTVITASQPQTTNYTLGSTSSTLYVSDEETVINVDSSFNKTYGDASFNLNVSSNSPASFQYSIAIEDQIYATVDSSGFVTIVGACPTFVTITISQDAYENVVTSEYEYSAASTTTKLYIAKKQTIIYNPPPATSIRYFNYGQFFLSGNPFTNDPSTELVRTSSNEEVASFWDQYSDTISVNNIGTAIMFWRHAENDNFTFAEVTMYVTVLKGFSVIQYWGSAIGDSTVAKTFGQPSFNLDARSYNNPDSQILFSSSNPSIASIDSTGEVTMHHPGSVILTISQAENAKFNAASDVLVSLFINTTSPRNPLICNTPDEFNIAITLGTPFITITDDLVLESNTILTNSGSGYQVLTNSSNTILKITKELPSFSYIVSKNNITDGGLLIGGTVEKDMNSEDYRDEFDPMNYPNLFLGMEPLITSNIVVGDKNESDIYNASYWDDLGDDIFDEWGYFFIYDVVGKKYFFPILSPENEDDGVITNQTFNAFGKTFTLTHGWPVEGIFKIEIMCNDNNFVFNFGCYGNMGSDGDQITEDLIHTYSIGSETLNLFYHMHAEEGENTEILYTYVIPTRSDENTSKTYNVIYDDSDMSLISIAVTKGLIVYFSKTNDVKEWVSQDLTIV
jgi:hypothetical protein